MRSLFIRYLVSIVCWFTVLSGIPSRAQQPPSSAPAAQSLCYEAEFELGNGVSAQTYHLLYDHGRFRKALSQSGQCVSRA